MSDVVPFDAHRPKPEHKLWFQDPQMVEFRRMAKEDAEYWAARLYQDRSIGHERAMSLLSPHVGAASRFEGRFPKPCAGVHSIADATKETPDE